MDSLRKVVESMTSSLVGNEYCRSYVAIHLDAIEHNLNEMKKCIKDNVKTMAVVKANAYGHGSVNVARYIEDKVDCFAVAGLEEGIELRTGGIKKDIMVLSYTNPMLYKQLVEHNITATIYDYDEAEQLSKVAKAKRKKAKVHIAVDTGMGRIGFQPNAEGADTVKRIAALEGIEIEGVFSHYACADCKQQDTTLEQTKLFDEFISMLEERGMDIPLKHLCNSAGTMNLEHQYNMCRLGIALYGLYPSGDMDRSKINLVPAMEVISQVVHVKEVPAGFKIGYGHIYETPSPRKIATVSIGYADGYKRCFGDGGHVLIHGKKAPVVGRVCMDLIMVDVTDIAQVTVGTKAVVLGESEGAKITAEELGEIGHSFNYEIICTFMQRVPRLYYIDGKLVE